MADAGGSNPPPPKLPLDFENTEPTKNKNKFVKACRLLVRNQVGLRVGSWNEVPTGQRHDLFRALQRDFELEDIYYDYTMSLMSKQLKQWRSLIRGKHFTRDMSIAQIKSLKEKVPVRGVTVADWDMFVDREANEGKFKEREQGRENRAHYRDPHHLGTKSYNEFDQRLASEGIHIGDRSERYLLARTNKGTNALSSSTTEIAKKVEAYKRSMDSLESSQLDTDALARTLGKDGHGRIRGVSSKMSKLKYKGLCNLGGCKRKTNDIVDAIRSEFGDALKDLQSRVSKMEGGRPSASSCSDPISTSTRTPSVPLSTPQSDRFTREVHSSFASSSQIFNMISPTTYDIIAYGRASSIHIPGEIVNGVECSMNEAKVYVLTVLEGKENEMLYKPLSPIIDTIGRAVGFSVIWPRFLLHMQDSS